MIIKISNLKLEKEKQKISMGKLIRIRTEINETENSESK